MSEHATKKSSTNSELSQSPWIIAGIVLIAAVLVILGITLAVDASIVSAGVPFADPTTAPGDATVL